jgi:D-alanyl-D-alanine carboxypeptidase/D-alanyl-D-alanine-endopeptidase (penicillin-binding protein 4)
VKGKGTTENSIEAVREYLTKEAGLEEFSQSDGSGLTRENRASPAEMVKLLLHMRRHKHAQAFLESLPTNGDRKGTLKSRMLAPDVKGRIRAKTGHIGGVSALSGYVESAGGDTYVFSILANAGENTKMGLPIRWRTGSASCWPAPAASEGGFTKLKGRRCP